MHSNQTARPVLFKVSAESLAQSGLMNCRLSYLSQNPQTLHSKLRYCWRERNNKGHRQKVEPWREKKPPKRRVHKANLELCSVPSLSLFLPLFLFSPALSFRLPVCCCLSDGVLLVHSGDKAVRVAVRENGWSKAPLSSI